MKFVADQDFYPTAGVIEVSDTPIHALTATEIVRRISVGNTTAEAVALAYLEHIAEREPAVQAWQYLDPRSRHQTRTGVRPQRHAQCATKRSDRI